MLRLLPPRGKIQPEGLGCGGKEKQRIHQERLEWLQNPTEILGEPRTGWSCTGSGCAGISSTFLLGAGASRRDGNHGEPPEMRDKRGMAAQTRCWGAGEGLGAGNAQPGSWKRNESQPHEHHVGQGVGIGEKHGLGMLNGTCRV